MGTNGAWGPGKACLSSFSWACAFFLVAMVPSSAAPPFDGPVTGVVQRRKVPRLEVGKIAFSGIFAVRALRLVTEREGCAHGAWHRLPDGEGRAPRSLHDLGAVYQDVARFSRS